MIVCEKEFDTPDANDSNYSQAECDVYAWIDQGRATLAGMENHRLSLRRNLKTGNFEVYRLYHKEVVRAHSGVVMISHDVQSGRPVDIAFVSSNFEETLRFINAEWDKWHWREGDPHHLDVPCEHQRPQQAFLCGAKYDVKTTPLP